MSSMVALNTALGDIAIQTSASQTQLTWIVDGYTTSDQYPYSSVEQLSSAIADTYTPTPLFAVDDINYIRNSVKATV
ncbi:MAG TPA: UPF0182 family protein, partial [Mycolicibacterium fallax]|nr:UPF0182 family protein [Mycolicibacterium fallax]